MSLQEARAQLKQTLAPVLKHASCLYCPPGHRIFRRGEDFPGVYLIQSGCVKLQRRGFLELRWPNDLVGEEGLQTGPKRAENNATAQVDSVLLLLPPEVLRSLENLGQIQAVLRYVLHLTAKTSQQLESLATQNIRHRILHSLLDWSNELAAANPGCCEIRLTQAEVSQAVGATRETTSTILNDLQRAGLIQLARKRIYIAQPGLLQEALHRCAAPSGKDLKTKAQADSNDSSGQDLPI